ncbi:hypothetical protein ACJJTC_006283 [Scirpophaga incertulas]
MNASSTICRICLGNGATVAIFENCGEQDGIHSKLSICVNEQVKNIQGYPTKICTICLETLETVYDFIQKYKESSEILLNGIIVVKNENIELDVCSNPDNIEIDIKNIKLEPSDFEDNEDCVSELTKPLNSKVKSKLKKQFHLGKDVTIKRIKSESKHKSNRIASSLLEGNFAWTGDKWCLETCKPDASQKNVDQKSKIVEKKSREIKIKLPKLKKPDPPKLCDICGDVFKTQDKLTLHKKKEHEKQSIQCPQCPRICPSKYYLNRHIKRRHDTQRPFICAKCGKSFAFKGGLTTHNRNVHDKHLRPKKEFQCKFCDKTYKCSKSIVVHERSVHTGQRPAECDICGSRFYHIDYLKEHMRLHTGETPFKCPICGRGYAQRCNMKSHLRIHRLAEIDSDLMSKIKPNYLKLLKDFR